MGMAEGDEGSQPLRTIGPLQTSRAAGERLETTEVPIQQLPAPQVLWFAIPDL